MKIFSVAEMKLYGKDRLIECQSRNVAFIYLSQCDMRGSQRRFPLRRRLEAARSNFKFLKKDKTLV